MTGHTTLQIGFALLAVPAVLACAYLLVLTCLSGRPSAPSGSTRRWRFDIIVPAHNEAAGIERTLHSLLAIDWSGAQYRVVVIADNCTDATAALARACGALVCERCDLEHRGKGYALEYGFTLSERESWANAVVVVDADSTVSENFLEAIACRLDRGEHAVQVHYGVLNPMESWRTRLMTVAITAFHVVRSRARERLGVSCGIRGNGWSVTHELLRRVPYHAYSLAEDLEFGIDLALAGYRVAYADEAHVLGEMVSGEQAARKQRERWERGRFQLIGSKAATLLRCTLARRSWVCADLAADLLVPPLSFVAVNIILLASAAAMSLLWLPAGRTWIWVALTCTAALSVHVIRSWQLSHVGPRALLDLFRVPGFLLWKVHVTFGRRAGHGWVRTERERP